MNFQYLEKLVCQVLVLQIKQVKLTVPAALTGRVEGVGERHDGTNADWCCTIVDGVVSC